jgi:hypothetical protein
MQILSFIYNDLYILYIKWYIMICITCIFLFIIGKKIYNYMKKKYNLDNFTNNISNLDKENISEDTKNNLDKENISEDTKNNFKSEKNNLDTKNNFESEKNNLDTKNNFKSEKNNLDKELNISEDTKNNFESEKNNLDTKKSETVNSNNIFYLYWTGGYDSTYRLCEMLIKEKKIVQPLYVTYSLDNDCPTSEDKCNKLWVRRNRKHEKEAMKNIRKTILKLYPWCKKLLLPTIYIDKDIEDELFNQYYDLKFYNNNLWPKKRNKHQYLFLSKYAYYHKIFVDTGILGIHDKTKFKLFLDENLIKIKERYYSPAVNKYIVSNNYGFADTLIQNIKLNDNKIVKSKHYMYYLRLSCYGKTKKDLLIEAKKYGFADILYLTWSCWFPDKKTGKQCGKCPMCKERIIPQNNNNLIE